MAPREQALQAKSQSLASSQLSHMQTQKASNALLKHINKTRRERLDNGKLKDLLETESPTEDAIWLVLTTKKHLVPQKRLKPGKISIPHSTYTSPDLSICLITPSPQRSFKDMVANAAFPSSISRRIQRVIDIEKLKKKYHSFESKRLLRDSHDLFLADDRIITYLPKLLGKIFYDSTTKRPIPVRFQASKSKEERQKKNSALPSLKPVKEKPDLKSVVKPAQVAHEIERTLFMTTVNLSSSTTTSVRVGNSSFTPEQLSANVEAVAAAMVEEFVPKKWKGVKAIYVKGATTMALPIWLAEQLWEDDKQVLEEHEVEQARICTLSKKKRKRLLEGGVADTESNKRLADGPVEGETESKRRRKKDPDDGMGKEMKERREKLRRQKQEIAASVQQ